MVWLIIDNSECSVYLLKQYYTHKLMWESHGREADQLICSPFHTVMKPQATADNKDYMTVASGHKCLNGASKSDRI